MPKLYSSKEIEKVLLKLDFQLVSQKGSHGKYKNNSGRVVILVMNKKEIPIGTFKSLLKQADISEKQFKELL